MSTSEQGELIYYAHKLDKNFKEIYIVPISDIHYGNPLFSKSHFLMTLKFLEKPNAFGFLNGDLCESTLRTSKGEIHNQVGSPEDQRDQVIEWLEPYASKLFGAIDGNHENRIWLEAGIHIMRDIAKKLSIPYRPEGLLHKISFGKGNSRHPDKPFVFWFYQTHGFGGARTKSAKAVKVERTANMIHADFYCLHPHTKVLRGDLTYTELGNIKIGDELIGVSEYPEFNQSRKVLHTNVTDVTNRYADTLKITLEDGKDIITTPDHLWLIKRRHDGGKLGGRYNWYRADRLATGDNLIQVFSVWDTPDDWISGYIAGLLDGEGSITVGNRRERQMTFTQKEGKVLFFFELYLNKHNISYRRYRRNDGCSQLVITLDAAKLLGMTQPARLAEKSRNLVEKRMHKPKNVKVVEIQPHKRSEVVTIETDAHTFIAEGLATHNCMSHDHVVNVAPDIYLLPDPRTKAEKVYNKGKWEDTGFKIGRVTAHRKMLIKTNAYLKWGGYAEAGGFPPSDLSTPLIKLLTPKSNLWDFLPDKPRQAVKVEV